MREQGMKFAGLDGLKVMRVGRDAHRIMRLPIGNNVIVLACARRLAHDLNCFIKGGGLFHNFAYEMGHRLSVPISIPASAHFADADALVIHRGDRADKTRVADVDPRMPIIGLMHDGDGILLQAHAFQIIKHPAMIDMPIAGRFAENRKAAAMKKLGEKISKPGLLHIHAHGPGDRVFLGQVARIHERLKPGLGLLPLPRKTMSRVRRNSRLRLHKECARPPNEFPS